MNNEPLICKYKPDNIDDVIGNNDNKIYFKNYIKKNSKINLLLCGDCGLGKTLTYNIILKKFNNKLIINLSDIRGIDIVNNKINSFLEKKSNEINTIVLDEVEHLTKKAQILLKELINKYNNKTRFIFICNNINNIISDIKNDIKLIKYDKINNEEIKNYLINICKKQNINPTNDGIDTILLISNSDIRVLLNNLEYISIIYPNFSKTDIYNIFNIPCPNLILNILNNSKNNSLSYIIKEVNKIFISGYSFSDIINVIHKCIINNNIISDENRIKLINEIGIIHIRNNNGNQNFLQLLKFFCFYFLL